MLYIHVHVQYPSTFTPLCSVVFVYSRVTNLCNSLPPPLPLTHTPCLSLSCLASLILLLAITTHTAATSNNLYCHAVYISLMICVHIHCAMPLAIIFQLLSIFISFWQDKTREVHTCLLSPSPHSHTDAHSCTRLKTYTLYTIHKEQYKTLIFKHKHGFAHSLMYMYIVYLLETNPIL